MQDLQSPDDERKEVKITFVLRASEEADSSEIQSYISELRLVAPPRGLTIERVEVSPELVLKRRDICPRCASYERDTSVKDLYQCPYCGEWYCKDHVTPSIVTTYEGFFALKRRYRDLTNQLNREWYEKEKSHPCLPYTQKFWRDYEERKKREMEVLDRLLSERVREEMRGTEGAGKRVAVRRARAPRTVRRGGSTGSTLLMFFLGTCLGLALSYLISWLLGA